MPVLDITAGTALPITNAGTAGDLFASVAILSLSRRVSNPPLDIGNPESDDD